MDPTLQQYDAADRRLTAVLAQVPPGSWDAPSPCEGWTTRDVVRHLVDTQRDFLAQHGVGLGDGVDLADPVAAWGEHAGQVRAALADPAVPATAFDGFFGPTTVGDTLTRFYVFDMRVHRWDVARAAGLDAGLDDAELDLLEQGAASFGDAIYMEGICKPGVEAPEGAPREAHVLARLGRVA